jgi:AraC-like DNA-binding protein
MDRRKYLYTDFFHIDHVMSDESSSRRHRHEEYEIVYVLEGDMIRSQENQELVIAPHSLLLIPPGAWHGWTVRPGRLCRRISIHFQREFLDEPEQALLPEIFNPRRAYFADQPQGRLDVLARALLDSMALEGGWRRMALRGGILSLLSAVSWRRKEAEPPPGRTPHHKQIQAVMEYLSDNLRKPLSLDAAARRFSMSKNYLNALFREETGTTVCRYIREQRLNIARREIETGKGAEETAYALGFNDYSAFFRAYKGLFGVSPGIDGSAPEGRLRRGVL